MLGAFEGALLDMVALLVSLMCKNRDRGIINKYLTVSIVLSNIIIVSSGLLVYENIFSLLPILGVIFETTALWLKNERSIRIVSLLVAPFWLVYNLLINAYGSSIGNVITLLSIVSAILRYDVMNSQTHPSRGFASIHLSKDGNGSGDNC